MNSTQLKYRELIRICKVYKVHRGNTVQQCQQTLLENKINWHIQDKVIHLSDGLIHFRISRVTGKSWIVSQPEDRQISTSPVDIQNREYSDGATSNNQNYRIPLHTSTLCYEDNFDDIGPCPNKKYAEPLEVENREYSPVDIQNREYSDGATSNNQNYRIPLHTSTLCYEDNFDAVEEGLQATYEDSGATNNDDIVMETIPAFESINECPVDIVVTSKEIVQYSDIQKEDLPSCPHCQKVFANRYNLKTHVRTKHGQEGRLSFACAYCEKVYTTNFNLKLHVGAKHVQDDRLSFACAYCKKMYTTHLNLKAHVRRTHQSHKKLICEECGQCYQSVAALQNHIELKHRNNSYNCDVCTKKFSVLNYFKSHVAFGHIQLKDGQSIICYGYVKFFINAFHPLNHQVLLKLRQMVIIPWCDANDNIIHNVSVGFTRDHNVHRFAKSIWSQIKCALNKKSAWLSACGSGRRTANFLKWEMKPEKAFALEIYMDCAIVASKTKGHIRELIGAIHLLAASDEFGFLDDCQENINMQVQLHLSLMAPINQEIFDNNMTGITNYERFVQLHLPEELINLGL